MADTLEKVVIKEICATGDKTNTIPDTTGVGSNALSYADGFPVTTATPQSDGGIPPKRTDMNKVLNMLSKNQVFLQNGGAYSFDSSVATAIGGYPKGARLLYKDEKYDYYIESLKDNNSDIPTNENIFVIPKKNLQSVKSVLTNSSQLPTASENTVHDVYLCSGDGQMYLTFVDRTTTPETYYWRGISVLSSSRIYFAQDTRSYWKSENSTIINLNTIYSWIKVEDVPSVPMPDYSSIGTSYATDTEHTAENDIFVIVYLSAQDKGTPARFMIGANVGLTADVELTNWYIMGANSSASWFIPVPKGYKWKVVSGNITTIVIRVMNIF